MADQQGIKGPWDSDDSQDAWNPSGAPQSHVGADETSDADGTKTASGSSEASSESAADGTTATSASASSTPSSTGGADSQSTQSFGVKSPYVPAPEYGANTDNPTQPLSAASYPFGAPEDLGKDAASKNQSTASGQNTGRHSADGQQPYGYNQAPRPDSGQQPTNQFPNYFGAPAPGANGNGGSGNTGSGNGPSGPAGPANPFGPQGGPAGKGGPGNTATQNKSGAGRTWLAAAVSAIIAALLVLGLGYAAIANGFVTIPSASSTSSLNSSSGGDGSTTVEGTGAANWTAVNKKVAKSVVSITAAVSGGAAKGSGAIIDTDGDIVTNNHVVESATQIQVTLNDGSVYSAKTVGTDSTTDLAVIKLEDAPDDLQAITFADSDSVAVGESIMAIGNPLGYENTATTGIVSALNRPVSVTDSSSNSEIVTNAIQIDAAINPGNSGGPTFNAAGEVIGINSSIATASSSTSSNSSESGSIGIGFAIPANLVQRVSKEIIKSGKVQHAQLGVTISTGSATADGETRAGAKVVTVTSGGASAKAGVKAGDVIVGFNGNVVSSMYSVLGYVRAAAVGDTVKLTVVRNSKTVEINVTLTQAESTSSSSSGSGNSNNDNNDNDNNDGDGDDDDNGYGGLSDPFGLFGSQ